MIVTGRPPNFEKLVKVFPAALKAGTIFAYAPNIYVSGQPTLSPALNTHEHVHLSRQQVYEGGPEAWWDRYLIDREFRLEEELLAHCAEYQYLIEFGSRKDRRKALDTVASRLCGPLYSLGLSPKKAAALIESRIK